MWDVKVARESLRRRKAGGEHASSTKFLASGRGADGSKKRLLRGASSSSRSRRSEDDDDDYMTIQQFSLSTIGALLFTCLGICFLFSACEVARVNIDRGASGEQQPLGPSVNTSASPLPPKVVAPSSTNEMATATTTILQYSHHQDLLMGYTLLDDTLKDEGMLRALKVMKRLTLRFTADEVSETMDRISASAKRRRSELRELRSSHSPDVQGKPTSTSPIGDAIKAMAKDAGTGEMLSRSIAFNVRFAVLQAQATRMVSAIAKAVAAYEVSDERKAWLMEVAVEYEAYRDEIVEHVRSYVRGEGANQDMVPLYQR